MRRFHSISKLLILIILTISVLGCGRKLTSAPRVEKGTGDGGGGNTCQGRPIESYFFDVKATPAFKTYIGPLYSELQKSNSDVYRLFKYTIESKNWFLIPCELTKLPDDRIGSAVLTEQAALQTFAEVWFHRPLVESMNSKDQALLFLHEIFMGIRLLKWESPFNQCKSFAPSINYCKDLGNSPLGTPKDLTPEDYADIRKSAADLLKSPIPKDIRDWENFMGERNFSFGDKTFLKYQDRSTISIGQFFDKYLQDKSLHKLPSRGYFANVSLEGTIESSRCSIEIDDTPSSPSNNSLSIQLFRENNSTIVSNISLNHDMELISILEFHQNLRFSQPNAFPVQGVRKGEKFYIPSLYFDAIEPSLKVLVMWEHICLRDSISKIGTPQCEESGIAKDAKKYVCSEEPLSIEDLK